MEEVDSKIIVLFTRTINKLFSHGIVLIQLLLSFSFKTRLT